MFQYCARFCQTGVGGISVGVHWGDETINMEVEIKRVKIDEREDSGQN